MLPAINEILQNIRKCNEIYNKAKNNWILYDDVFFLEEAEEQKFDKFNNENLFKQLTFFSYQIIYERPGNNIKFIHKISKSFKADFRGDKEFEKTIHNLRTYFGHFLEKGKGHDEEILKQCKLWFMEYCNKIYPKQDTEWEKCVVVLIQKLQVYIGDICEILAQIDTKKDERLIGEQWKNMQKQYIPQYKKDAVLEEIKSLYNVNIENKKFFNQFNTKINERMSFYNDFSKLYNCIEEIVLREVRFNEITGKEVAEKFLITGKELQTVMKKVVEKYKEEPSIKKEEMILYIQCIISAETL